MYILFDIGGTNMRIVGSSDGVNLTEPIIMATPQDFDLAISTFAQAAKKLADGEGIKAACGGVRALDPTKQKLINHPNFPLWVDKPLKSSLENALNAPLIMENDAALAGLGETHYGAGKNYKIVAYLTISTGVGGARIVDGKIDRNTFGFEPGQQIIGDLGHLEKYISGPAIEERFKQKPQEIKDPRAWDEIANWLSIGLNNTIVYWSPEVVIIGGSVIDSIPMANVEYYLKEHLKMMSLPPKIEKAKLGNLGGIYGSLVFLKQNLNI